MLLVFVSSHRLFPFKSRSLNSTPARLYTLILKRGRRFKDETPEPVRLQITRRLPRWNQRNRYMSGCSVKLFVPEKT
jgi:hypothetical protein